MHFTLKVCPNSDWPHSKCLLSINVYFDRFGFLFDFVISTRTWLYCAIFSSHSDFWWEILCHFNCIFLYRLDDDFVWQFSRFFVCYFFIFRSINIMCLSMFLLQIIYFDSVQLLESMFIYLAKFAEVLTIISSRLAIISFFFSPFLLLSS